MESRGGNSLPDPLQPEATEPSEALEIIGLKEALLVLEELDASDEEVLAVLEQALMAPVPELNDEESWVEYREHMKFASEVAHDVAAKTSRSAEFRQKLLERLAEIENPS